MHFAYLCVCFVFTAPFNIMRNLNFESPPTVAFSLLSINIVEVFENDKNEFNGVKRSHSSRCLVDFDPFCYFCRFLFFQVR